MLKSCKRLILVSFLGVLAACGAVHHRVVTPTESAVKLESVNLAPVEVSSREQNPNALALNEQWKTQATTELRSVLAGKQIAIDAGAATSVRCQIEVTYGNRALRYWVGFGAGAGHLRINLSLVDADGKPLYALSSAADLAVGLFGGSMADVVRKAIAKAAKEFAAGF